MCCMYSTCRYNPCPQFAVLDHLLKRVTPTESFCDMVCPSSRMAVDMRILGLAAKCQRHPATVILRRTYARNKL
jgi:hypothetical protein